MALGASLSHSEASRPSPFRYNITGGFANANSLAIAVANPDRDCDPGPGPIAVGDRAELSQVRAAARSSRRRSMARPAAAAPSGTAAGPARCRSARP